jgi:hypothetical protein
MLTTAQIRLVKMAQRAAGLSEADYHAALATASGLPSCTTSKDPRLGDEQFDRFMGYAEAIYWRALDQAGTKPRPTAPFLKRGYWAAKNPAGNTSRDRHADAQLQAAIRKAESYLQLAGKGTGYLAAIRAKTGDGWPYLAALKRTVKAESAAQERLRESRADHEQGQQIAANRAGAGRVYTLAPRS